MAMDETYYKKVETALQQDTTTKAHFILTYYLTKHHQLTTSEIRELMGKLEAMPDYPKGKEYENAAYLLHRAYQVMPEEKRALSPALTNETVQTLYTDSLNLYNWVASQAVQPISASDSRFKTLFAQTFTNQPMVTCLPKRDGSLYTERPYLVGASAIANSAQHANIVYPDGITETSTRRHLIVAADAFTGSTYIDRDAISDRAFTVSPFLISARDLAMQRTAAETGRPFDRQDTEMVELAKAKLVDIQHDYMYNKEVGANEIANRTRATFAALIQASKERSASRPRTPSTATKKRTFNNRGQRKPVEVITPSISYSEIYETYTEDDIKRENAFSQIRTYLGSFMSRRDMNNLMTHFTSTNEHNGVTMDKYVYQHEVLDRARLILEHLYDKGFDIEIGVHEKNPTQVVARIGGGVEVRILDSSENLTMIGRVHTPNGDFYRSKFSGIYENGQPVEITEQILERVYPAKHMLDVIDFATGATNKVYPIAMSKEKAKSYVNIEGMPHRSVVYSPSEARYKSLIFNDAEEAENHLRQLITLSRSMFRSQLVGDESDISVAELGNIQEDIERETEERLAAKIVADNLVFADDDEGEAEYEALYEELKTATIDAKVDELVGSYEDGFNAARVSTLSSQVSSFSTYPSMITAMKYVGYDVDKIKGTDYSTESIKEAMVTYDHASSQDISEVEDPFIKDMLEHTQKALYDLGVRGMRVVSNEDGTPQVTVDVNAQPMVRIDKNGIVEWRGFRALGAGSKKDVDMNDPANWYQVGTNIGQIFAPNEKGIIHTNFASNMNYDFVPGYRAHYQFKDVDTKSRMERLRVVGYEQSLRQALSATVREQVLRPLTLSEDKGFGGRPIRIGRDVIALNKLYHGDAYGLRFEQDWYETSQLKPEVKDAILETNKGRVRLHNKYAEEATTFAALGVNENNTSMDASMLFHTAGNMNARVLHDDMIGRFDLVMTGTNKSQGLVLYLAEGAKVDKDTGEVLPAENLEVDENGEVIPPTAPIRKLDYFEFSEHNAWDRNQMSPNQLLTAYHVDEDCVTMLADFGGWTFDDSYVVSKEFAERNPVPTENGELRPLKAGDKISDFSGNKGTIGLIVDRDVTDEQAAEMGLSKEVEIFRLNPSLDVVGSPYSMVSRHNAGVVLHMQKDPSNIQEIRDANGELIGEAAPINVIVTDMLTDEKSVAYTEEELAQGRGRKVSGQLVWALNQLGADNMVREAFGNNDSSWATFREYLLVTGHDLTNDGKIRVGYQPHGDEVRNRFVVKEHDVNEGTSASQEFLQDILTQGGMLEMPFKLDTLAGTKTKDVPVLATSIRNNMELLDGEVQIHNYTKHYHEIYNCGSLYITAQRANDKVSMAKHQDAANRAYMKLQSDIVANRLGGFNGEYSKTSYMRNNIMSKRAHLSATGVATVDPRLPIDTIAVSPKIYETLMTPKEREALLIEQETGKVLTNKKKQPILPAQRSEEWVSKDGRSIEVDELGIIQDHVAIWRDPSLRGGAVRGMKVIVDDRIEGFSMNGAVNKSFDGDFDGDAYGIKRFVTEMARKDLAEKVSLKANLVDAGSPNDEVFLNISMDIVSGAVKAGLVNPPTPLPDDQQVEGEPTKYSSPKKDLVALMTKVVHEHDEDTAVQKLNGMIHTATRNNFGGARIMLSSYEKHMESIEQMVLSGAKGSMSSFDTYKEYYNGEKTREDARTVQAATGIKSDLTGVAGSYSQQLISLMRNVDPKVALEVTYVITQGTLQIKKDAQKGEKLAFILNDDLRNLFNGRYPRPVTDEERVAAQKRDKFASPTKEEFKTFMKRIYNDELDVPLRDDYLDVLTDTLAGGQKTIQGIKKLLPSVASPMDYIAYGGGFAAIQEVARKNGSLLEGKNTLLYAPKKVLEATPETILAKSDTQNIEARLEKAKQREALEALEAVKDDVLNMAYVDPFSPEGRAQILRQKEEAEKKAAEKAAKQAEQPSEPLQDTSDAPISKVEGETPMPTSNELEQVSTVPQVDVDAHLEKATQQLSMDALLEEEPQQQAQQQEVPQPVAPQPPSTLTILSASRIDAYEKVDVENSDETYYEYTFHQPTAIVTENNVAKESKPMYTQEQQQVVVSTVLKDAEKPSYVNDTATFAYSLLRKRALAQNVLHPQDAVTFNPTVEITMKEVDALAQTHEYTLAPMPIPQAPQPQTAPQAATPPKRMIPKETTVVENEDVKEVPQSVPSQVEKFQQRVAKAKAKDEGLAL